MNFKKILLVFGLLFLVACQQEKTDQELLIEKQQKQAIEASKDSTSKVDAIKKQLEVLNGADPELEAQLRSMLEEHEAKQEKKGS